MVPYIFSIHSSLNRKTRPKKKKKLMAIFICLSSEVEMAFNGIVSLIMLVPVNEADEIISIFAEIVSKAPPGDKRGHLRLRL